MYLFFFFTMVVFAHLMHPSLVVHCLTRNYQHPPDHTAYSRARSTYLTNFRFMRSARTTTPSFADSILTSGGARSKSARRYRSARIQPVPENRSWRVSQLHSTSAEHCRPSMNRSRPRYLRGSITPTHPAPLSRCSPTAPPVRDPSHSGIQSPSAAWQLGSAMG